MRGLSTQSRMDRCFGPRAMVFAAALAGLATTAYSDNSADIEIFRDYAVGLWQVQANYGYASNVTDYKFADNASVRMRVVHMDPESYVRIRHVWGGTLTDG